MYFVEFDGDTVDLSEERGSQGAQFFYIEQNNLLVPVSDLGREESDGRSGGTESVTVSVPASVFENEQVLYQLGTTNSGRFSADKYTVQVEQSKLSTVSDNGWSKNELSSQDFEYLGSEAERLEQFHQTVPAMVGTIKSTFDQLNLDYTVWGTKTRKTIENPTQAVVSSLMFNSAQSRNRSVDQRIKNIHEVYGIAVLLDTLNAELPEDNRLWFETANERPSAILDTPEGKVTLWYQFSLKSHFDMVKDGVKQAFGISSGSKNRQHVRPDVVLFEGEYETADELRETMPEDLVVIDMKHRSSISSDDLKQLSSYGEQFPEESSFIVGSLAELPRQDKYSLVDAGWDVARLHPHSTASYRSKLQTEF